MAMLEKEIEKKLVNIVKRHGGLCLKWVCPGWAGVPDRIVLLPGGRVIFVELKRPEGGVISSRQRWWAHKLTLLGFDHYYLYDACSMKCFELDAGIRKREDVNW